MMAVEVCTRCDKYVDLDWNVEEIVYINSKPVCIDCLEEDETAWFEENGWPSEMTTNKEANP